LFARFFSLPCSYSSSFFTATLRAVFFFTSEGIFRLLQLYCSSAQDFPFFWVDEVLEAPLFTIVRLYDYFIFSVPSLFLFFQSPCQTAETLQLLTFLDIFSVTFFRTPPIVFFPPRLLASVFPGGWELLSPLCHPEPLRPPAFPPLFLLHTDALFILGVLFCTTLMFFSSSLTGPGFFLLFRLSLPPSCFPTPHRTVVSMFFVYHPVRLP